MMARALAAIVSLKFSALIILGQSNRKLEAWVPEDTMGQPQQPQTAHSELLLSKNEKKKKNK